jgi:UrcA family protein
MYRFAIAAIAATLIAGPVLAADTDEVAVKIKTSDLNLQTEAGAKTALERINRAAKGACSDVTVGSRMAQVDKGCVADVSARLVKQLKAPMVEAAYAAQKSDKLSQG